MVQIRSHWHCKTCFQAPQLNPAPPSGVPELLVPGQVPGEPLLIPPILPAPQLAKCRALRVLNLYAGIGGNRKHWHGCNVTAVENNPKIAAAYAKLYPNDKVVVADAHEYLLTNYAYFDFIWASPTCLTHTMLNHTIAKKRYVDLSLYQIIIFLRTFFKGKHVIENVVPYYDALIKPDYHVARHCFWSNFKISDIEIPVLPFSFTLGSVKDIPVIEKFLDIYLDKPIYMGSKNPVQVYRNCVHPLLGKSIFEDFIRSMV